MKPENEQKLQPAATATSTSVQTTSQGKAASASAIDRLKEFGGFSLKVIIDRVFKHESQQEGSSKYFLD